jgi:hypothetical protein
MIPYVEHRDLGGDYVEGHFRTNRIAARLAVQTGLPYETVRARIIEAYGYCRRPPKSGRKTIIMQHHPDRVDELAISAMRRVIDDFVSMAEVRAIRTSYLASDYGDAYWVAWDLGTHPYIVIAALRNLEAEGRLPIHPSCE